MNRSRDCELFAEQLDELVGGALTEAEAAERRRHATACADCGMLLAVREHLVETSQGELEARVPDELADSVWPSVQARVARRRPGAMRSPPRRGWLVPALAAASLTLLVGCGYLLMEVGRLRERSDALVRRVEQQERWLTELNTGPDLGPRARTAALAGGAGWQRMLARRDRISVAELRELLEAVPAELTVLDAGRLRGLRRELPFGTGIPAATRDLLDPEDGLQAGELLRLLDALNLDSSWSLAVSRLLGEGGNPAVMRGGL